MYLMGQGHEHLGPGTSMVQRINWTTGQNAELASMGFTGLGCACNGSGPVTCGVGCNDLAKYRGVSGLGLFDSMDFTTWGVGEFAVIGVGAYLILSLAGDTRRVQKSVKRYRRRRAVAA